MTTLSATRIIEQNFINVYHPPINVESVTESALTADMLSSIFPVSGGLNSPTVRTVGLAPAYTAAGTLAILAIATPTKVIQLQFQKAKASKPAVIEARRVLQDGLLGNTDYRFYAFDMGPLALSLYLDHRLQISNGVDVQDACIPADDTSSRNPIDAIEFAMSSTGQTVHSHNISEAFIEVPWSEEVKGSKLRSLTANLALRAWVASYLPSIMDMEARFQAATAINTKARTESQLLMLANLARSDQRLDSAQANSTAHDFAFVGSAEKKVQVKSGRFQNKLRGGENAIRMNVVDDSGAAYTVAGKAASQDVNGRSATIKTGHNMNGKVVTSVLTEGRDGPTLAEKKKALTILRLLQKKEELFENPFLKTIWFGDEDVVWPDNTAVETSPEVSTERPINPSQLQAVEHMLKCTDDTRITIIQGPPGTGKTSVIATFVETAIQAGHKGIWLLAQSNVAVKNIAEKLAAIGFNKWRLLVSKDFHHDWHEHLYYSISKNVIQTDRLKYSQKEFQDCQVILCTLSTLSNPSLSHVTSKIPVKTLVIDEASQIAVNDYIPVFSTFSSIEKLCFIGDDKQLPPYGQEEIQEIQSIFEISHLRSKALFLDTQYRMPAQIGDFISDTVYDGQLGTNPLHPVSGDACFFIDVDGCEKRNGTSWENAAERQAIMHIATQLQEDNESYKIITPYDAQRSNLEHDLKEHGLVWQNKCFNVDSFQGNEDNWIIVSTVRSKELGFLKDLRRTNVMLTRCKKGMYVCSSWDFLVEGAGAKSLVGRLAAACGDAAWISMDDVKEGNF